MKQAVGSPGTTVPASTPATQTSRSQDSQMREEDLYPAEHIFVQTLKDSDNPNEMPYTATTDGYPLYKGSYGATAV